MNDIVKAAADRLTREFDWDHQLSVALSGGYGPRKRNEALADLRIVLDAARTAPLPFQSA